MGVAASKRAMREATSSSETTGTCAAESDPKPKCSKSKRVSPNSRPNSARLSRKHQSGLLILRFIRLICCVACLFKFLKALSQSFHRLRHIPAPSKQGYGNSDNSQFPAARNSEEN